jgi:hypothetical protein
MNNKSFIKTTILFLSLTILLTSCASTTVIQSEPSGANVYIDGEKVGVTPHTYNDTKIVGSTVSVKLTKDGYEDFLTSFSRNEKVSVGAVIGGIFFLVPFLWVMEYKPNHNYELVKVGSKQ